MGTKTPLPAVPTFLTSMYKNYFLSQVRKSMEYLPLKLFLLYRLQYLALRKTRDSLEFRNINFEILEVVNNKLEIRKVKIG